MSIEPQPPEPVDPGALAEANAPSEVAAELEQEILDSMGGRRATCLHCGALVAIVGGRYTAHTRPAEGDHCRDSGRPFERPEPLPRPTRPRPQPLPRPRED